MIIFFFNFSPNSFFIYFILILEGFFIYLVIQL
jgi:hypothetical protein